MSKKLFETKNIFLTYSQANNIDSKEELLVFLQEKLSINLLKYIVA